MGRGKKSEQSVDVHVHRDGHGLQALAYPQAMSLPRPPHGPAWRLDWRELDALPWLKPLADCPQEPVHHGEGDVLAHTRLVVEALVQDPAWRALDADGRQELFLAALLHDVGKVQTTRREDGRLVAPGHSRRGAVLARRILWEAGFDPRARERVCQLVRHHMAPFFLVGKEPTDARRRALEISWQAGCDRLAILARADARGRVSATNEELKLNVELFQAYAEELGCLAAPYPFASDHARFLYFRKEDRDPAYAAYDDTRLTVTVLSGLPGAGKDSYLNRHLAEAPVVSLDGLRQEMGVSPEDDQGRVVQAARERARQHLRAGADFVYNATNLSRRYRQPFLDLFAAYNARIEIVQVEVKADRHDEQNVGRGEAKAVPAKVIERMLDSWEAPTLVECHSLRVVD